MNTDPRKAPLNNLELLALTYEDKLKSLKERLKASNCSINTEVLKDQINSVASGLIALNKVHQLQQLEKNKNHYTGVIEYTKAHNKIINSNLF